MSRVLKLLEVKKTSDTYNGELWKNVGISPIRHLQNKFRSNNRIQSLTTIFFVIILTLSIYLDAFLFPETTLKGIYFIPLIFACLSFWSKKWILLFICPLLAFFSYKFATYPFPVLPIFIIECLIYYLVAFSITAQIKHRMRQKYNTIEFITALANSIDARDVYTGFHSNNVANYAFRIAKEMKLRSSQCDAIYLGGLLHDIGKIGVEENILKKTSRLTDEEFDAIKQHPVIGYEMLKHITSFLDNGILDMIHYHHERFDGKGYPRGLKGGDIPLVARIMAVADSFDAMTTRRAYREKRDLNYTINEIRKNKGTQFDPQVADVFLQILEREGECIFKQR